ncbi:META domain-containing protein [Myroides sp. M-43]|uniref:META domain-containing protein n=1 Tax=Myroides oncorhynchi TaxID=2893756 RepID=UPI001E5231BF|nr:META domain-containing protein [Myroides oncorhynchi]MCC9044361.1 META domain-containing protein [Myroides oncorhynchi]
MKKYATSLFLCLTSLVTFAQQGSSESQEKHPLAPDGIWNVRWVLQDNSTPGVLTPTDKHIMLSREYGSTITGYSGCNIFEIPVTRTSIDSKGIHMTTRFADKTGRECSTQEEYAENKFLKRIANGTITFNEGEGVLYLLTKDKVQYVFADEKLDKLAKDIRRYDWKLVQLDGSNEGPYRQWITFDFHNYLVKGNTGCTTFDVPFAIDTKNSTITLFDVKPEATKTCGSSNQNSIKDHFLKYFDNSTYQFKIDDQSLNIYQNGKIVMQFDLAKKNSL